MPELPRLPFFSIPASGETVFSVVGRCIERLGIAAAHLLPMLTGQKYSTTLFAALPGHLQHISSAVPLGHPWNDVSALVKCHTALPYFTYFHTEEQRASTEQLLASADDARPVGMGIGLATYRLPVLKPSLRFCMACLHEQYRDPGHSYFQLAHQLPGVTHCWLHGELLAHGCHTCGTYPLNNKKLTMPGQCLCKSFSAEPVKAHIGNLDSAIWLARESAYLLTADDSSFDRRERLREGVFQAGFCRGSLVDYEQLADAIERRFGGDFLNSINHPARDDRGRASAWIRRSLPKEHNNKRLSTIVGLLILGAAFDTAASFERDQASVFAKPDASLSVLGAEPAPPWAASLKDLLVTHKHRISTCAARLKTSSWNVAIEARKQQIPIPLLPSAVRRIGAKRLKRIREQLSQGIEKKEIVRTHEIGEWTLLLIELDDLSLTNQHRTATHLKARETHRKRVLSYLKKHPGATRQTIRSKLSGCYDFLISKDKEWFHKHVRAAARTTTSSRHPRHDWTAIDRSLAEAIQASANEMLLSDGRPTRITQSLLLRKQRAFQRFSTRPEAFPRTSRVIEKLAETQSQYLARRIAWGMQRLIESSEEVSIHTLRRESGISAERLKAHIELIHQIIDRLKPRISPKSILNTPRAPDSRTSI